MPKSLELSPREYEIVQHLANGLTISEISATIGVSRNTTYTHLRKAMKKLKTPTVITAVLKAFKLGQVTCEV
jgi:DNA-binding CsgD family transcriptional regulator